ncbi:hypothetical protein [Ferruginibacter sp.]
MKLVTYLKDDNLQLALLVNGNLYDTDSLHPDLPNSMSMFLNYWGIDYYHRKHRDDECCRIRF